MSEGRTVVVTGGGSGIGRATARRFAGDGDFVVVADINEESARSVAGEIAAAGGDATHFAFDVARDSEVGALADAVEGEHGGADVLVTCAGLLQNVTSIRNMDMDEHDRIWDVNYRGVYLCCRDFGRRMAARGRGCIVNISSTSAVAAFPLHAYAPAKAAISHLTAILASDLGPRGVRVNAVLPGYVLTEQMQARIDAGYRDKDAMQRQGALGRIVLPDEVADGIHFLCSDAARAITGISMPIDGGWLSRVTYVQHPGWPPMDWDPDAD
ncbi:MAG: SDR family NAD(P)-dependent oxidoreductase [Thiotrichales bacterium]|nr:SDR family NAD(P)-dependent oxidoreductase [Thiotrichales bacterium]